MPELFELATPEVEQNIIRGVEQAIRLTQDSAMDPSEAIYKVADQGQFELPHVQRMVEAFNQSALLGKLKTGAGKDLDVKLADPKKVLTRLVGTDKVAAVTRKMAMPEAAATTEIVKEAAESERLDPVLVFRYRNATASSLEKMASYVKQQCLLMLRRQKEAHQREHYTLTSSLQKMASMAERMQEGELKKFCQLVANGFPRAGTQMISAIQSYTRRPLPHLEKQANSAVFPLKTEYLLIADIYQTACRYLQSTQNLNAFVKYAESTVSDALDRTSGFLDAGQEAIGRMAGQSDKGSLSEGLDPQFYNSLKEVDTRRNFMDLALYDPALSKYDMPTLISAFNSAVSAVPEAASSPHVLKTLMLQRINTGGIQDVFQTAQEQVIGKALRDRMEKLEMQLNAPVVKKAPTKPLDALPVVGKGKSVLGSVMLGAGEMLQPSGDKGDKKSSGKTEDGAKDTRDRAKELLGKGGVDPLNILQAVNSGAFKGGQPATYQEIVDALARALNGDVFDPAKDDRAIQILNAYDNMRPAKAGRGGKGGPTP